MENLDHKKNGFLFTVFLYLISTTALIKFLFLKYVFRKDTNCIRNNYYGSIWYDRFSDIARVTRIYATNWRALDVLYNFPGYLQRSNGVQKFFNKFWLKLENARAIQNRGKIVRNVISENIKTRLNQFDKLKILSIASGSAQPLLEGIELIDKNDQKKIDLVLLDNDKAGLDQSLILAKDMNVQCNFSYINNKTTVLKEYFKDNTFDIIEMVGFLDYRPKDKAIELIEKIRSLLKPGGCFLVCNILPNKEKFFLDWVLLWPMIYRTKSEFQEILDNTSFKGCYEIIDEPLKVHIMSLCKK